jgi:predicted nucleotidyltransferase
MNTSNQTYKELAIPYFKEVFDLIDDVMTRKGVPYYLVGVSAMALELLKKGFKPSRGTKDIDFAIMVSTIDEYDEIMQELVKLGFNKAKAPFTLYHPEYNTVVDVLPFGQIEENDTVSFNERYSDLHVLGFKEVLEDAVEVKVEEKIAMIPPIPGIVLLKLVAWNDRPEDRGNDLADILKIIEHYYEFEWDDIVENHFELLADEDFDQLKLASRVLGRKVKKFLVKSKQLESRILNLLEENLKNASTSAIAKEWARLKSIQVSVAHEILLEFQKGLME